MGGRLASAILLRQGFEGIDPAKLQRSRSKPISNRLRYGGAGSVARTLPYLQYLVHLRNDPDIIQTVETHLLKLAAFIHNTVAHIKVIRL